ncbi:MAG: Flp pilus assembly protein CpaB [Pseudomonadota bacterium]
MRIIALIFLVFGIALAGGAIFFASEYFQRLQANVAQQDTSPKVARIVAAREKLSYGQQLNIDNADEFLRWIDWPADSVPEGAFTNAEALFGAGNAETRTVLRGIEPGELLLQAKISGFGEDLRVAAQVTAGKRAFTIPIDAVRGVAGFIAAGDRVDILLTRKIDREPVTSIILQDVPVIATDQRTDKESTSAKVARTATVEVDPNQAAKLTLAQSVGKLTLTLRGMNEAVDADVKPVGLQDLPAQPEKPKAAPRQRATTVRVRRGGQAEDIKVD